MSFLLYRQLYLWMLHENTRDNRFAHMFLTLSWNLCCCSYNTVTIHTHHMEWSQDALFIYFEHEKNDQSGSKKRDPWHIYVNPLNPDVCPILILVLYLMTFPPSVESTKLFPGKYQYKRFSKYLEKILVHNADITHDNFGVSMSDIGVHLIRKGE